MDKLLEDQYDIVNIISNLNKETILKIINNKIYNTCDHEWITET